MIDLRAAEQTLLSCFSESDDEFLLNHPQCPIPIETGYLTVRGHPFGDHGKEAQIT